MKRSCNRNAFTLIELLIVIFIISLVYFIGLEGFEILKPKPKALTLANLKESIRHSEQFQGEATFLCTDKCRKCYLRKGLGSAFVRFESPVALNDLRAYTIDDSDQLVELEYGRFKDQKICLVIQFYRNGSSTPLILENEKGAYFLPSFFGKAKQFDSIEDAKAYWLKDAYVLNDSGAYYR